GRPQDHNRTPHRSPTRRSSGLGPPLYPISLSLALAFREVVGADFPVSFSAGIDQHNFADAVASGLTPITTCTDLLRPGGYGRLRSEEHTSELQSRQNHVCRHPL